MYAIVYFPVSYYYIMYSFCMSYIQEITSKEEFLESRTSPRTRSNVEYSLIQFDRFCISKFQRNSDNILKDLKEEHSVEKVYSILNAFVIWASKDHPEIVTFRGRYKTIPFPFKTLNPITIRRYLNNIRAYFEEVGGFELSDRRMSKRVKISKTSKVDLVRELIEQLKHEEMLLTPSGRESFDHPTGKHNDMGIAWELSIHGCIQMGLKIDFPGKCCRITND